MRTAYPERRSRYACGTARRENRGVCSCLTGDRGRCQNAGEERPRLRAAWAEGLVHRDRQLLRRLRTPRGQNGWGRPLSDRIGPWWTTTSVLSLPTKWAIGAIPPSSWRILAGSHLRVRRSFESLALRHAHPTTHRADASRGRHGTLRTADSIEAATNTSSPIGWRLRRPSWLPPVTALGSFRRRPGPAIDGSSRANATQRKEVRLQD